MSALILDLPDEKLWRLEVIARAGGTSLAWLFVEMSSVIPVEADAESRFQLRGQRGARKEASGLELLGKALRDHDAAPRSAP